MTIHDCPWSCACTMDLTRWLPALQKQQDMPSLARSALGQRSAQGPCNREHPRNPWSCHQIISNFRERLNAELKKSWPILTVSDSSESTIPTRLPPPPARLLHMQEAGSATRWRGHDYYLVQVFWFVKETIEITFWHLFLHFILDKKLRTKYYNGYYLVQVGHLLDPKLGPDNNH